MSLLGKEMCFADLLVSPADESMIDRLRERPIRSVLDIGCADGIALLTSHYMFGASHLEGIDEANFEEDMGGCAALNERRDAFRPPENNPWPKMDHAGYGRNLKTAYGKSVHEYNFLLPSYDLIILSNVIHYWSEHDARETLGRIAALRKPTTLVYLRIKLGLDPNGFMNEEERMDDNTIEAVTREFAKAWGLGCYMQLVEGHEHYTFTNLDYR